MTLLSLNQIRGANDDQNLLETINKLLEEIKTLKAQIDDLKKNAEEIDGGIF